jgi:hypothetical protein
VKINIKIQVYYCLNYDLSRTRLSKTHPKVYEVLIRPLRFALYLLGKTTCLFDMTFNTPEKDKLATEIQRPPVIL